MTPKQEAFAQALADGMTQSDAYRVAYGPKNMAEDTIHQAASRLAKNSKILARLEELREPLIEKALWTREMSVKALVQAYREGNAGVKVSAVKELNAMHGYNAPKKIDVGDITMTIAWEG